MFSDVYILLLKFHTLFKTFFSGVFRTRSSDVIKVVCFYYVSSNTI